VTSFYQKSFLK